MTFNKSQGQSVANVGLDLRSIVFCFVKYTFKFTPLSFAAFARLLGCLVLSAWPGLVLGFRGWGLKS